MKKKLKIGSGSIILRSGSAAQDQNETDPRHCVNQRRIMKRTVCINCVLTKTQHKCSINHKRTMQHRNKLQTEC